jgi:hypothetical protein
LPGSRVVVLGCVVALVSCAALGGLSARHTHTDSSIQTTALVPIESSATDPDHRFDNDIPDFLRADGIVQRTGAYVKKAPFVTDMELQARAYHGKLEPHWAENRTGPLLPTRPLSAASRLTCAFLCSALSTEKTKRSFAGLVVPPRAVPHARKCVTHAKK